MFRLRGGTLFKKVGVGLVAGKKKQGTVRVFFVIFTLLCLIVVTCFIWQAGIDKMAGPADKSSQALAIDKILKKALRINTKTPLMIDKSTRLDRVLVEDQTIIYQATLVNLTLETAGGDIFKKEIGQFLSEKYCNNEYARKALELGVKYGHEYYGNDGALLYTATITVDNCRSDPFLFYL